MGDSINEETEYSLKSPTTYKEQVTLLKERRLIIRNEQSAIKILQRVNYYRLSAYFLSLKEGNVFKENATLEQAYNLYKFDMRLRNLLMEQLEIIEVSFRTHIAYLLAHKYGTLGYMNSEHFINESLHTQFLKEIDKSLSRQKELFIKHHRKKYGGNFPVWVAIEVTSFGVLSMLYSNMKVEDKKEIAKEHYKIPHMFIENWLMILSYTRNMCAHFARLYNKSMTKRVRLDKKDKEKLSNDKIFAAIFIMGKISKTTDEWTSFVTKLEALLEEYKDVVELDRIGFPENWIDLLR